jgi:demethylmenaquinone methyltransferase/2-methoxy-6-polyprenyl-1,4-benzoquinol methylase
MLRIPLSQLQKRRIAFTLCAICAKNCLDIDIIKKYNYNIKRQKELFMSVSYKLISKFYGLLDIIYFRKNTPRKIILNKISNENMNLLEIAVGTAENIILFGENRPNLNITGIDISMDMLEIARKKIEKKNIKNIKIMKMDALNLDFQNKTFDLIIISLLFHEIPENISNKILSQCKNVLKNNGSIYILEWEKPKKILQRILFFVIELMEPKEFKIFMKKDLREYFNKIGLKIKSIEYGDYSKVIELKII